MLTMLRNMEDAKAAFIALMLSISLVFAGIAYGTIGVYSLREKAAELDAVEDVIYAQVLSNGREDSDKLPVIKQESIKKLDRISDGEITVNLSCHQAGFINDESFGYDELFSNKYTGKANEAAVSKELLKKLKEADNLPGNIRVRGDSLYYYRHKFSIVEMKDSVKNARIITDTVGTEVSGGLCIVFPMDNAAAYNDFLKNSEGAKFNIALNESILEHNKLEPILKELDNMENESFSFEVRNIKSERDDLNKYDSLVPGYVMKYCLMILLVISFGMIGIIRNHFQRNKEEYSLRLAIGESNRCLLFRIMSELLIALLVSGIIGVVIGSLCIYIFPLSEGYKMSLYALPVIILVCWTALVEAIYGITLHCFFRKKLPGEILMEK